MKSTSVLHTYFQHDLGANIESFNPLNNINLFSLYAKLVLLLEASSFSISNSESLLNSLNR